MITKMLALELASKVSILCSAHVPLINSRVGACAQGMVQHGARPSPSASQNTTIATIGWALQAAVQGGLRLWRMHALPPDH